MKFDPYQPVAEICVGRERLLNQVVASAINRRCVLLFGGRQSGKTTALLKIEADLKRPVSAAKLDTYICPVYIDLTVLPVDAKAPDFFNLLAKSAVSACFAKIEGFARPNLDECKTVETFASAIKAITGSAGNIDLTLLFLIDEAERVLGERFPRGFQDNLFAILYGSELASESKIGIVFSGAQGLYKFSEDETSPIGSRAGYEYVKNIEQGDIDKLLETLEKDCGVFVERQLVGCIYELTGGHAGLTARLCQFVFKNGIKSEDALRGALEGFITESKQLMRLWATSLSVQARALQDELAHKGTLSKRQVIDVFSTNRWDPLLADRAIEELTFTGLVHSFDGLLSKCCSIYWHYIADYLPLPTENPKSDSASQARDFLARDVVWALIEKAEIGLRSYVSSVYADQFKGSAERKVEQALGAKSMLKVRENVSKSNKRYKYTPREELLNIFDGLYLGQLGQLMMWNEAWPRFQHLAQDKRELEMLLAPIIGVRTDKAHFYKVPLRELDRCKLHCEDVISIVEKFRPKNTV